MTTFAPVFCTPCLSACGLSVGDRDPAAIRRRTRLVLLLDASQKAGLDPLPTLRLHLIAYLANVLSPVWELGFRTGVSLGRDGSILKSAIGPFYPDLQAELDRLVGMGVVRVEELNYWKLDCGRFRLDGKYRINTDLAKPVLDYMYFHSPDAQVARCVRELVLALSSLSDGELDRAVNQDATYGDPNVGMDNVIDFGEWVSNNYSAAAALRAGELVDVGARVGASEHVHLYIRHLRRRLQGER